MSNEGPDASLPSKAEGTASGVPSTEAGVPSTPPSDKKSTTPLTPEEQMALFEKELKENDWGHQPC
jgi:hypothetical protein